MHKEKGNSSEQQPRGRMQTDGGGGGGGVSVQEEANAGPAKRVRRPNVRLNHPYYENAGGGGRGPLQQRWDAFKKDLEGARKSKTLKTPKTPNSKNGKKINPEGTKDLNLDNNDDGYDDNDEDDDMAIGNWKNLNSAKRNRDFKSKSEMKRAKPLNFVGKKDLENEKFEVSNGSDSENQREEEENLGANTNLEVSFSNEKFTDGDEDDYDDDDNVVEKQGKLQRGLMSSDQDLDEKEKDGVRVWLNELGLGKYASIFEFHEVDDAILPFLTLEDLKEMGIGAVGSRRKMYRSIQKLGKGFS